MSSSYDAVISSLVKGLLDDQANPVLVEQTAQQMRKTVRHMPRHLSLPIIFLTLCFDWAGILRGGRIFRCQSAVSQRAQIEDWKKSFLSPCRELIRFHEKMSGFIYYSYSPTKN